MYMRSQVNRNGDDDDDCTQRRTPIRQHRRAKSCTCTCSHACSTFAHTDATLESAPYPYSKARAEEAAWKYCEETDGAPRLVVCNPSMILGEVQLLSAYESLPHSHSLLHPQVLSPSLTMTPSMRTVEQLLAGAVPGYVALHFNIVDVKVSIVNASVHAHIAHARIQQDVARAHVLLMESESAAGRYLCVNRGVW